MLKGCQREMIVLQTQESPLFESAYFVLRRGRADARSEEMLAEADRLVGAGRDYLARRREPRRLLPFLLGFLAGSGLVALAGAIIIFLS